MKYRIAITPVFGEPHEIIVKTEQGMLAAMEAAFENSTIDKEDILRFTCEKEELRLSDLLSMGHQISIEYRCNAPKCDDEDDMLFGACYWDGKELISEDGDSYYLNDVIEKYEWNDAHWYPYDLTVWIEVKWNSDGEIDV